MTPGRRAQKKRYIQRKLKEPGINGVKRRKINGRKRNKQNRRNRDTCDSKHKYRNWEHANSAAHHVFEERGVCLKIYPCEYCNEYHLTSNLEYENIQVSKNAC